MNRFIDGRKAYYMRPRDTFMRIGLVWIEGILGLYGIYLELCELMIGHDRYEPR